MFFLLYWYSSASSSCTNITHIYSTLTFFSGILSFGIADELSRRPAALARGADKTNHSTLNCMTQLWHASIMYCKVQTLATPNSEMCVQMSRVVRSLDRTGPGIRRGETELLKKNLRSGLCWATRWAGTGGLKVEWSNDVPCRPTTTNQLRSVGWVRDIGFSVADHHWRHPLLLASFGRRARLPGGQPGRHISAIHSKS